MSDHPEQKITNIEQMRNRTLVMLDDLFHRRIDLQEAKAVADVCNSVMNSIKIEMQYANMRGEEAHIDFIQQSYKGKPARKGKLLDGKTQDMLGHDTDN